MANCYDGTDRVDADLRRLRFHGPLSALEHRLTRPSRPDKSGQGVAGFASSVRIREATSAEYDNFCCV